MTLKKEQQFNGIWLPDSNQNKTITEGIVVSLWSPCSRVINGKTIAYTSSLSLGDHVLFNHWSGIPVTGYKTERFRLVKECNWATDKEGGIISKLDYADKQSGALAVLNIILSQGYVDVVDQISKRFLLIDRDQESKTLSGR